MQRDLPRANPKRRLQYGYRRLLGRDIPAAQLQAMEALYHKALQEYKARPELVCAMDPILPGPESAALALVANALLNLDEAITKN
jgi:N-acetyl-anhydromuramyl-L-alanine amidase AmpD